MTLAYVVTWRWLDGSGCGAVSVHWTRGGADQMVEILSTHGDRGKTYAIECVPCEPLP